MYYHKVNKYIKQFDMANVLIKTYLRDIEKVCGKFSFCVL